MGRPDEEVHAFVNDLVRPVGTYLLGRRMYETMVFWERRPDLAAQPPVVQDFAEIWQRAEKIVYSKTLQTASSAKTQIEGELDPDWSVTSRSAVPSLRPRRSRLGWSTSTT